jgi:indolepyruvate ferredoxin oxidoreductase alpha subunit
MVHEAFDISEKFNIPVIVRLVTRLAHSRAGVVPKKQRAQNPVSKTKDIIEWTLIPAFARQNYQTLLEKQKLLQEWSAKNPATTLTNGATDLAIITSGLGGNYYEENLEDYIALRKKQGKKAPTHLHIGAYPLPEDKIRKLYDSVDEVLILEEGQPFIAQRIFGIVGGNITPLIKAGELDPDNVRKVLGLPPRKGIKIDIGALAPRIPVLCKGCPHIDSYQAIKKAVTAIDPRPGHPDVGINSDIGCYSLGVAPPLSAIESIVCMGACVGMAKGAVDAGLKYGIAIIGDSTFIHSGITPLIDAVEAKNSMTLIILDNSSVAMTGCQPTMLPSENLKQLVVGCGVKPERVVELDAKPNLVDENAAKVKAEIERKELTVIIFKRECIENYRRRIKAAENSQIKHAD